ncbi:hypothetical protein CHS0354_027376 [Potamilus streckersoni]|uniref:Uncharacterized protein n=1 Tax=Potamilus streckersoni TaxID=2493646 RepID=A0AAE0SQ29_9BIVA|nr:hypothetical protein CHS0354_027376 [Potamilus streckersoni]
MSRHRGAKHRRRYELLGGISLLSPEYLLSVERWPFHTEPPDHYDLLSHLLDLSVSQLSTLMPLHSPRVLRIFTENSISLSWCWRQRGSRYAIRAGRNLPDKEFRYLRTVIVTAAVYRDFNQELAPHHLIFRHRAGVTPYTSTFVFAECCVFIKQSPRPLHCDRFLLRGLGIISWQPRINQFVRQSLSSSDLTYRDGFSCSPSYILEPPQPSGG